MSSAMYHPNLPVIQVPGTQCEGGTGIYRNSLASHKLLGGESLITSTLYTLTQNSFKEASQRLCLGKRSVDINGNLGDYTWLTYAEVANQVDQVASGLIHLAKETLLLPNLSNWKLGIFSCNRIEWNLSDLAAITQSLITVALFDTYGQAALEFVIQHAELPIIISSTNYIHRLLHAATKAKNLKIIVSMDSLNSDQHSIQVLKSWAQSLNILLIDFDTLRSLGSQFPVPHTPPSPDDIYTICYTSGTTGLPKGAICTHSNYASIVESVHLATGLSRDQLNISISYLPAAHCFERASFFLSLYIHGQVGFYSGNIQLLVNDITVLQPTIMASVPRLLNRIYDQITKNTIHASGLGPSLFRIALKSKLTNYKSGQGLSHPIWDRLIFSKVRQILGGRINYMITGSAPIDPKVLDFLRVTLGCQIYNGYGATETCAGLSLTIPNECRSGSVGVPLVCNEFKLMDVPEMGYLATDKPFPRGEICVRGKNVFKGYYKSPEQTDAAIDKDGWYHTGDIVVLDKLNQITIIDRKKNIFKLSQGEYVAPEKLEVVYTSHPLIMQMFVFGDSLRSHLVGIMVPDPETFLPWARKIAKTIPSNKDPDSELYQYCHDLEVNRAMIKVLKQKAIEGNLNGFEQIHAIYMEPNPFTVDNGFITPTFKLKRHELSKHYQSTIQALYDQPIHSQL